jgi:hypothetical protein
MEHTESFDENVKGAVPSIDKILPRRGAVKQIGGNNTKAVSENRGGFFRCPNGIHVHA